MKYTFVNDDDCHCYLIPVDMKLQFWEDLEHGEEDYWCDFNNKYGQYRVDSPYHYTFENPEHV